jgi:hypothetical protein
LATFSVATKIACWLDRAPGRDSVRKGLLKKKPDFPVPTGGDWPSPGATKTCKSVQTTNQRALISDCEQRRRK